jgi:hypothetical protein
MVDPAKKTEPNEQELRDKKEAQRTALGQHLKTVDDWVVKLTDPVLGSVGEAFRRATDKIIDHEDIDFQMIPSAVYHSFRYLANPGQTSFSNYVLYGIEALDSCARLLGARTHEFIHALQYHTSAALHADPFNEASDIIVSPYDYILRKERLEQDAYVKRAWLCSLAVDDAPGIVDAMKGTPLPIDTFQTIRAESGSLQETFTKAARDTRNLLGVWKKGADKTVIADEWHARALEEYAHIIQLRLDAGDNITFVKLAGDDMLEIGSAFGPNTFGNNPADPALTTIENLSPENAKKLAEINAKLGITSRDQLPTLESVLQAKGTTRAAYLEASKKHVGPPRPDATAKNDNHVDGTTAFDPPAPKPPTP